MHLNQRSRDTFGASIVSNRKKILASAKSVFLPEPGKGIIPRECANHHLNIANGVLDKVLCKCPIKDVDVVAFSQGPGLPPVLRVGAALARWLAQEHKKKLIGVNHCIAHLEISSMVTKAKAPVMLYVSGGNTQVIAFDHGKYRVFGETLDIPLGNLFDTFGREAGIRFPAGPTIERLAKKGKDYIELPYVVKGMDVSFSGILTHIIEKYRSKEYSLKELCYSLQETTFAMLVEVSERAMAHCQKGELIIAGGVASNQRLQEMCRIMCKERKAKFHPLPQRLAVDNPEMIAWLGLKMAKAKGRTSIKKSMVLPRQRTDQVKVFWRGKTL